MTANLRFDYAIQRPDGKCYNGRANVPLDEMFTDHPQHIFYYTEVGAHQKIANVPAFSNCRVVRWTC